MITYRAAREKRAYIARYYAMIELIDDNIGRLLDVLDETGQRENTLIIFMSDHGEMLGDHGFILKGTYFYEGFVHVPLIFSWPKRLPTDVRCDDLVELVNIAPTLLEAAGLEVPYHMQGKSLWSLLTEQSPRRPHKESVYCEFYNALLESHHHIRATIYFDGKYKIVVYHGKQTGELYDHEQIVSVFLVQGCKLQLYHAMRTRTDPLNPWYDGLIWGSETHTKRLCMRFIPIISK